MVVNNGDLLASLGRVGSLFYVRMVSRLETGNYPTGDSERGYTSIQSAASVQSPKMVDGSAVIEIHIDLKKAPYAGAYEWGSGIHATRGPKVKYPIVPRQGKYMVFPEGDWPGWEDRGGKGAVPRKGIFFLTEVEHPGVEAKPYIAPTVAEIQPEVRKILARDFKTSLLRGTKTVEVFK